MYTLLPSSVTWLGDSPLSTQLLLFQIFPTAIACPLDVSPQSENSSLTPQGLASGWCQPWSDSYTVTLDPALALWEGVLVYTGEEDNEPAPSLPHTPWEWWLTFNVQQREMRVAGCLWYQAEIEAVAALWFVSVHHTDGLNEL